MLVLEAGRLVADGEPADAALREALVGVFGGAFSIERAWSWLGREQLGRCRRCRRGTGGVTVAENEGRASALAARSESCRRLHSEYTWMAAARSSKAVPTDLNTVRREVDVRTTLVPRHRSASVP
ncbi:MAG: hypothetical protein U1F49_21075 [Rubrivivax sp.]